MGLELLLVLTKILSAKESQIKLSGLFIQLIICKTLGGPPISFLVPSSFFYPHTGYYLVLHSSFPLLLCTSFSQHQHQRSAPQIHSQSSSLFILLESMIDPSYDL